VTTDPDSVRLISFPLSLLLLFFLLLLLIFFTALLLVNITIDD